MRRTHTAHTSLALVDAHLVDETVHGAPHGGSAGRHDGDDAPVRAEVLDAPHHADDDGREGEDGAVAEALEAGDEGEEGRVGLDEAGGEDDLREREQGCGGEEEGEAGDGAARSWVLVVRIGWRG